MPINPSKGNETFYPKVDFFQSISFPTHIVDAGGNADNDFFLSKILKEKSSFSVCRKMLNISQYCWIHSVSSFKGNIIHDQELKSGFSIEIFLSALRRYYANKFNHKRKENKN